MVGGWLADPPAQDGWPGRGRRSDRPAPRGLAGGGPAGVSALGAVWARAVACLIRATGSLLSIARIAEWQTGHRSRSATFSGPVVAFRPTRSDSGKGVEHRSQV